MEVIGALPVAEGDEEVLPLLPLVDELEGEGRGDILTQDQPLVENVVVDYRHSQLVTRGWSGEENSSSWNLGLLTWHNHLNSTINIDQNIMNHRQEWE